MEERGCLSHPCVCECVFTIYHTHTHWEERYREQQFSICLDKNRCVWVYYRYRAQSPPPSPYLGYRTGGGGTRGGGGATGLASILLHPPHTQHQPLPLSPTISSCYSPSSPPSALHPPLFLPTHHPPLPSAPHPPSLPALPLLFLIRFSCFSPHPEHFLLLTHLSFCSTPPSSCFSP